MNTLENLLKRLVESGSEGASQPCRICNNPTVATDLCDSCIKDELLACDTGEDVESLFDMMVLLRGCNEKLDGIEANIKEIKDGRV